MTGGEGRVMKRRIHDNFTSPRGIKYFIHQGDDGLFKLWMWSNPQSGWGFVDEYGDYKSAFDLMVGIDPSPGWVPEKE